MALTFVATTLLLSVAARAHGAPVLVRDIDPTPEAARTTTAVSLADGALFFAVDERRDMKLWRTDGTPSGTGPVKDIRTQLLHDYIDVHWAAVVNGVAYFVADDGVHGDELWRSDGTPGGTVLVRDITPGPAGTDIRHLTSARGLLFFAADDGIIGEEVWVSDGTDAGTQPVLGGDTLPFFASVNELTRVVNVFAGQLVAFVAVSGDVSPTDGNEPAYVTELGYTLLADLEPGPLGSIPAGYVDVNAVTLFRACTSAAGCELYRTSIDGSGTSLVLDVFPGPDSGLGGASPEFLRAGGGLLFEAFDGLNMQLWWSDGTGSGTTALKDVLFDGRPPDTDPARTDGVALFLGESATHGDGVWRSDGTPAGTVRVKEIGPDYDLAGPRMVRDDLYIGTRHADGTSALWQSDGTEAGTRVIADPASGTWYNGRSRGVLSSFGLLYTTDVAAAGDLWVTDGTAPGTFAVADVYAATKDSSPTQLTPLNGSLLFRATQHTTGEELWRTDGSSAGTTLLADLVPGRAGSRLVLGPMVNNVLYFAARPAADQDHRLWRTDGTAAGTRLVGNVSTPMDFVAVGDTLFFSAYDTTRGRELWRTDGTAEAPTLVRDIAPGTGGSHPSSGVSFGGALLFVAGDPAGGRELWRSDGTEAGTVRVKGWPGVMDSGLSRPVPLGGRALFRANDGATGEELWRTDGTESGTTRVADIRPGAEGSRPRNFEAVGDVVYFGATDGATGRELWKSDGTAAGTTLVKDINPGAADSAPVALTAHGGRLFFFADDGVHGRELWTSDGTAAGTRLVRDVFSESYDEFVTTSVDGFLYFRSDVNGRVWRSDGTEAGTEEVPGMWDLPVGWSGSLFFQGRDESHGVELFAVTPCGDGVRNPGEGCDDENLEPGDCCSASCQIEPGEICSDVNGPGPDGTPPSCGSERVPRKIVRGLRAADRLLDRAERKTDPRRTRLVGRAERKLEKVGRAIDKKLSRRRRALSTQCAGVLRAAVREAARRAAGLRGAAVAG